MEAETRELAGVIGARVRRERRARGWTLDRLAEAAGVSRRMVVNVEQGSANPSIGTLLRLSDALGLGLPALVEPPDPAGPRVTRAGDGAVLWSGEHGGRGVLVAGTRPPDVVELWDWTLQPGDRHASEAHAPGTCELLQVLHGELTVEADEQAHTLGTGDALTFLGDTVHAYSNLAAAPVRFTLCVYEPGVGRAHGPARSQPAPGRSPSSPLPSSASPRAAQPASHAQPSVPSPAADPAQEQT